MDTLTINEKLKQAGVAEQQAQAVTSAIQEGVHEAEEYADDAVENGKKELAKQADIVALRQDLHKAVSELLRDNARLREDNAKLRQEMAERDSVSAWRSSGLLVAMTTMFTFIVKFL